MVGNISEAQNLLNDYYDAASNDRWKDVMEIYLDVNQNNGNTLTEAQISELETIANSDDEGHYEAQSLLVVYDNQEFLEEISYPNENKSYQVTTSKPAKKRKPELAGVYPNPAKGEFYITYVVPTEKDNASIDIYNMEGKMVRSEDITNGYGIFQ